MMLESNTFMVEQREREIKQIVKSIAELNDIFKDLACMVADQVCYIKYTIFSYLIRKLQYVKITSYPLNILYILRKH